MSAPAPHGCSELVARLADAARRAAGAGYRLTQITGRLADRINDRAAGLAVRIRHTIIGGDDARR